ncbi:MAG: DNA recombination protein RmuC [Chlorobi bacterium]|nr:DNA recombination protein RmuC [Chlorobiota bacterium]
MLEFLLVVIIILLVAVLYLVWRGTRVESTELESALLKAWESTGIAQKLGELNTHTKEIKELHKSIETMLRIPSARGAFGEITLEKILSDQLPPDMFGIRQRLPNGKIPDAFIKSTAGVICIDSKFPLDNYRKMMETNDAEEKEIYKNAFFKNMREHLEKIANDYVRPAEGTADFAFAYIPSEAVYWFLVTEGYDLLKEFAIRGVQVVSPLTLSHKIELIKAGVHAQKLSEEAEQVYKSLLRLKELFEEVDDAWRVFYHRHLRNLNSKAEEINHLYDRVRNEFDRIYRLKD